MPGRITVDTRFPIGLLRAWSYIRPDMRCLVYPKSDDSLMPLDAIWSQPELPQDLPDLVIIFFDFFNSSFLRTLQSNM